MALHNKMNLKHICTLDPISNSDKLWVKIKKEFLNIGSEFYFWVAFIPPVNSTYGIVHGKEIGDKIEKQMEYFFVREMSSQAAV